MKNMIIVAAVIVTACITSLSAQAPVNSNSVVAKAFETEFASATDVKWVKIKNLYRYRFNQDQEYCLAFFTEDGRMILSGRKISLEMTPLSVKKELQRVREKQEKKNDLLSIDAVYELNDSESTKYFAYLGSESVSISLMAYGNGESEILKKENHKIIDPAPSLITTGRQ